MRIRDPRWRQFGSGIRDGEKSDPGSGINIPDPPHCANALFCSSTAICFIYINLDSEFFKRVQSSLLLNTKISNRLILQRTACIKTFLPICWCRFILYKIRRSAVQAVF
jgi:hypothetical protein